MVLTPGSETPPGSEGSRPAGQHRGRAQEGRRAGQRAHPGCSSPLAWPRASGPLGPAPTAAALPWFSCSSRCPGRALPAPGPHPLLPLPKLPVCSWVSARGRGRAGAPGRGGGASAAPRRAGGGLRGGPPLFSDARRRVSAPGKARAGTVLSKYVWV